MSDSIHISELFSSIQGEGILAGRRQIFVRLTECNLDCSYCDTDFKKFDSGKVESRPGSAEFLDIPQPMPLNSITAIIADWQAQLVSFTGGEPLLNADLLAELLPDIRKIMPIHLETNGTMHLALGRVKKHLDYISMDMKLPSTAGCTGQLWDIHALFLHEAQGCNVSVKVVIGDSTNEDELNKVCDIVSRVDRATPLFLQPLTLPDGRIGIKVPHLLRLQELASSRLPNVRVIPQMHKLLGAL
jgi:7-carboxy-7-deazaguanine synthase